MVLADRTINEREKENTTDCKVRLKEIMLNRIQEINDDINVMYTNIDGIIPRILELRDYLREGDPDVVCLAETKLTEDIYIRLQENDNYNVWRKDRKGKNGGGVLILIKSNIKVCKVEYGKGKAEVISVLIKDGNRQTQKIVAAYVPPKTKYWTTEEHEQMLRDTVESLEWIIRGSKRVIMVGDFNCNNVKWETFEGDEDERSWGNRLLNLTLENMMIQRVSENTRFRGEDKPSRLDLVFTKEVELIKDINYVCPIGKSDHVILEMMVKGAYEKVRDETHWNKRRNYAKANFPELRNFFENINWGEMENLNDIQQKYDFFLEKYEQGITRFVPTYKVKAKRKEDWFNMICERAKLRRDKAWKKMRRKPTRENKREYKQERNEYVRIRREEERKFEKDLVEKCKEEPKLFYRFINKKMKHKESITKLRENGEIFEESKDLCEILNKNFQSVFTNETEYQQHRDERETRMLEFRVNKQEVMKLMKELKERKALDPDGVSGFILKECRNQLVVPIYDIIKCSIVTGKVPREWKRADIIPIYKCGNKEDSLNYRPVSLTSVVCKMCEKVIKEQWTEYLEREGILNDKQFGFRKARSCVTNLISFYSRVIDITQEREGWVDCIYLDLKKAFDKVPHKRLLWKLKNIGGLKGTIWKWMEDYLQGREMRTVVRDEKSDWKKVTSGVPQGSVLAPIMFLIYVNDMTEGVSSYMSLFADDAKLLRKISNQEDCKELQKDLDRIHDWSKTWEMEFNTRKCHLLEMGKSEARPMYTYKMGDAIISRESEEKDLGVFIQDNLSPEKHINKIFGDTFRTLRNIEVAFHYMDKDMLKKIFTTMIRPKLEYAAVVWSPSKKKHIRKLERIQRIATKMVPELKELTYEERLKEMKLPTLEERRERGDLITIYKLMNNLEEIDRKIYF